VRHSSIKGRGLDLRANFYERPADAPVNARILWSRPQRGAGEGARGGGGGGGGAL
jgi:hypothetical protein